MELIKYVRLLMEFSTLKWNRELILLPKWSTRNDRENWKIFWYFFRFCVRKKREAFMDHWDRTVLVWTDMSDKPYHCFHFRLFVRFGIKTWKCSNFFSDVVVVDDNVFFFVQFFGHFYDATMALTNERDAVSDW